MYFIYILGPAGAGKSYLTRSLSDWLRDKGFDVATVNLDPAADWLPYTPDIDIRDYITTAEVMKKYNLGPNGGLILSVDLSTNYMDKIRAEIEDLKPNYVVIDTPGQLEIFAFRAAGPTIISQLSQGSKALSIFLIDSYLASRPSSFLSMIFLAISTALRHGLPQINVLSKCDILSEEDLHRILRWIDEPTSMIHDLSKDEKSLFMQTDLLYSLENVIRSFIQEVIPLSAITWEGLDQLYAQIQRIVAGGEDYLTEEPSEIL